MMKNSMTDLRNHLFMALEDLSDSDKEVDLERVKRITEVGKVLVETAKVEVQYLALVGDPEKSSTGFMNQPEALPGAQQP